jgi:hypothetical protein
MVRRSARKSSASQVGVLGGHGVPGRFAAGQLAQGGGQARVHAGESAPVGFVLAVGVGVGRALGQRHHGRAEVGQHGRHRQLGTEQVHLGQVVAQHHVGLAAQGQAQGVGGHEGVAVAVTTDPLAHAQERWHRPAPPASCRLSSRSR